MRQTDKNSIHCRAILRRTFSEKFVGVCQVRKNSLNIKFLGGIFLGHPGPRRRDIPDKNFMQVTFFCCFRQGVAGMSRPGIWVGTSRIWKNFMQENFGLIFRTLVWEEFSEVASEVAFLWKSPDASHLGHLLREVCCRDPPCGARGSSESVRLIEAQKPTQNPEIPKKHGVHANFFEKFARTFAFLPVTRVRNPTEIVQKNLFK